MLHESLNTGLQRSTRIMDAGASSRPKRARVNAFRGATPSPTMEHDFCFLVSGEIRLAMVEQEIAVC